MTGEGEAYAILEDAAEAFAPAPTMETVREFAALQRQRMELQDALAELDRKLGVEGSGPGAMEKQVLEYMAEQGMESLRVDGMTLFVRRELWAGAAEGDRDRAIAALKAAGLAEFVHETFNIQTLSAYVRERDRAGEPLPAEFDGSIAVSEVFRVGKRRR